MPRPRHVAAALLSARQDWTSIGQVPSPISMALCSGCMSNILRRTQVEALALNQVSGILPGTNGSDGAGAAVHPLRWIQKHQASELQVKHSHVPFLCLKHLWSRQWR